MIVGNNDRLVTLAIVVPCFNEAEIIATSMGLLETKLRDLIDRGMVSKASFLCFVDDGSQDATWSLIEKEVAGRSGNIKGIKLAGNVGHQKALLAGLEFSAGRSDLFLTIDADLQDDLNVVEEMLSRHLAGADIVFGVRSDRTSDGWFKKHSANLYYRLSRLLGLRSIAGHADFRLMSRKAVLALLAHPERNLYLRGICASMGFQNSVVLYSRRSRVGGVSKYSLHRMVSLGWDGITSFSVSPLRLISLLGVVVFVGALIMSLRIFYAHVYLDTTIPGWSSTVLPIFMLGGLQLLSLGVIGEYIAKIYIETKRRPRYLIDEIAGEES